MPFDIAIHSQINAVMLYIILNTYFFFFFANDLLLAIYFISIFGYGNDVRQKVNSSNFLF